MEKVVYRLSKLEEEPSIPSLNISGYDNIILSGEKFTDTNFKPSVKSLFSENKRKFHPNKVARFRERIIWKRIQDIFDKDEIEIVKDVSPEDTIQGELGDWYFISTLCSLAQHQPEEVRKIFLTKTVNEAGIYWVRLLVNGDPTNIYVDDYIPYDKLTKGPIFAGKKTKNIWPILLEKAWAKINGSYEDIVTGSSCESLRTLIPYPIQKFKPGDKDLNKEELWNDIKYGLHLGYVITGSSNSSEVQSDDSTQISESEDPVTGIISNHWYSIIGTYELQRGEDCERVLKISNPWGKQSYKGKWCDWDLNWTNELKEQVNFSAKQPGEFFMAYKDFLTGYDAITICKWDSNFNWASIKLSHNKGSYCLVKITSSTKSCLQVSINQYLKRLFKEGEYTPAMVRVMLAQKTSDPKSPFKHLAGCFSAQEESVCIETSKAIEEGVYYLYVELDWENTIINTFTCNIIGYGIKAEELPHSEFGNFFRSTLKDFARNKLSWTTINKKDPGCRFKFYLGKETAGYGFYYSVNFSKTGCTVYDKFKFTQKKGVQLLDITNVGGTMVLVPITNNKKDSWKTLELKPKKAKFIIFKRVENSWNTRYSYKTKFKHTNKYLELLWQKEGKLSKITNQDWPKDDMKYYSLSHDYGRIILFINNSEQTILDEYINFTKLENLKLTAKALKKSNGKNYWSFTLKPKHKIAMHLRTIDIYEGTKYSFSYSHNFLKQGEKLFTIKERREPEKLTSEEMTEIIEARGKKVTMRDNMTQKALNIYYKSHFFDSFYAFLFVNNQSDYKFQGTFSFKLENLKVQDPSNVNGDGWQINLQPGQSVVKKLLVETKGKKVHTQISMSYYTRKIVKTPKRKHIKQNMSYSHKLNKTLIFGSGL